MSQYSPTDKFKSKICNIIDYLTKKKQNPKIIFATKYLDKYQFISFIQTALDLNITPPCLPCLPCLPAGRRRGKRRGRLLIGENRIQDAKEKLDYLLASQGETLRSQFTYIMIGKLQKNKINKGLEIFDEIHSIDSIELAITLDQRLESKYQSTHWTNDQRLRTKNRYPIFLEVNIADDRDKYGFKEDEINEAIIHIKRLKNISISGLMTMPPSTRHPKSSRKYFRSLKLIANRWQLQTSMGTSQDWQVAVSEGADIIRMGSIIFS